MKKQLIYELISTFVLYFLRPLTRIKSTIVWVAKCLFDVWKKKQGVAIGMLICFPYTHGRGVKKGGRIKKK